MAVISQYSNQITCKKFTYVGAIKTIIAIKSLARNLPFFVQRHEEYLQME